MNINKSSTELKGSMSQRGADVTAVTDLKTRRLFAWAAIIASLSALTIAVAEIITALK